MSARREVIVAVSRCPRTNVTGQYERHASRAARELTGSQAGGRWGPPGGFSVLYLGRPRQSVVVEAYRHLVDPFEGMTGEMVQPRRLLTVEIDVTNVLDLTSPEAVRSVGLSDDDLASPIGDYEACWTIARAAHQLGLHGILAPSATGMGETLALYDEHLPANELPRIAREEVWNSLPADPRRLRLVDEDTG